MDTDRALHVAATSPDTELGHAARTLAALVVAHRKEFIDSYLEHQSPEIEEAQDCLSTFEREMVR